MNAPHVTEKEIEAAIAGTDYVVLPDNRTTICLLTLDNGFTVRGEASCVCVENFDRALGEQYALKDAKSKVWPLLGFRLADRLFFEKRLREVQENARLAHEAYNVEGG